MFKSPSVRPRELPFISITRGTNRTNGPAAVQLGNESREEEPSRDIWPWRCSQWLLEDLWVLTNICIVGLPLAWVLPLSQTHSIYATALPHLRGYLPHIWESNYAALFFLGLLAGGLLTVAFAGRSRINPPGERHIARHPVSHARGIVGDSSIRKKSWYFRGSQPVVRHTPVFVDESGLRWRYNKAGLLLLAIVLAGVVAATTISVTNQAVLLSEGDGVARLSDNK